jgi:hypothetical protein
MVDAVHGVINRDLDDGMPLLNGQARNFRSFGCQVGGFQLPVNEKPVSPDFFSLPLRE